jgi:hypothetical protein
MNKTKVFQIEIESLMGRNIPVQLKGTMRNDVVRLFDLNDYFPDCKLLVNISASIISLLSRDHEEDTCIIVQRILTEIEMRMLLPLLVSPKCCRREVLRASYYCTYEILLQSMLFSDVDTNVQWDGLVQEHHHHLYIAHQRKTKRTEMRGVYNALFGLRQKLEQLGLTIRVQKEGYYLSCLVV